MLLKHKIKKEDEGDGGSSVNFQVGRQLVAETEMSYELLRWNVAMVAPAVCVSSKIFISCQMGGSRRKKSKKEVNNPRKMSSKL